MGRIRTIKPEFPQSETTGRLSRDARLLFIQLWTLADDAGRSRAASRMIASMLYPYDEDALGLIDGWLAELEGLNCIRRYVIEGTTYLEIVNWLTHQKVDRPSPSRLPEYREGSLRSREASTTDLGPRTLDLGPRKDICTKAASPKPAPYPEDFETFWKAYPIDPGMSKREAAKQWDHLTDDDRRSAIDAIQAFKRWVTKQGKDYRTVHACRFLSQRRFEGFTNVNGHSVIDDAKWERLLNFGRREKQWDVKNYGPPPNQPGCRVPAHLLKAGDGQDWSEWRPQ